MKKIISIIGKAGSGKDVSGNYFSKKLGIPSFTISEALRISARKGGIKESRENLIALGKKFAEKYGDDYLVKVIIENSDSDSLIITGMRQIGQLEYCKKYHEITFIGIEADSQKRYNRLIRNNKFSGSYKEFLEVEKLDEGKIQNVGECLKYCSEIIENNRSIEELEKRLEDSILSGI